MLPLLMLLLLLMWSLLVIIPGPFHMRANEAIRGDSGGGRNLARLALAV